MKVINTVEQFKEVINNALLQLQQKQDLPFDESQDRFLGGANIEISYITNKSLPADYYKVVQEIFTDGMFFSIKKVSDVNVVCINTAPENRYLRGSTRLMAFIDPTITDVFTQDSVEMQSLRNSLKSTELLAGLVDNIYLLDQPTIDEGYTTMNLQYESFMVLLDNRGIQLSEEQLAVTRQFFAIERMGGKSTLLALLMLHDKSAHEYLLNIINTEKQNEQK